MNEFNKENQGQLQSDAYVEQLIKTQAESNLKRPLVLAILGLICGIFIGVGIIFSVPALLMSLNLKLPSHSTTLKWSICLSVIGVILNLAFIISVVAFIVFNPIMLL